MRRENMAFVPERVQHHKPDGLKEQVFNWISKRDDGAVLGEAYKKFPQTAQRTVRGVVCELKNSGVLKMKPCRCHGATIYYSMK